MKIQANFPKIVHRALGLVLASFVLAAVQYDRIDVFPYRRCAGQVYNLTPIFQWWRSYGRSNGRPQPMPDWRYYPLMKVSSLSPNATGFLVATTFLHPETFFLTNYPGEKALVDGDIIDFFARKNGRHQFRRTDGSLGTVELLDFGAVMTEGEFREFLDSKKAGNRK